MTYSDPFGPPTHSSPSNPHPVDPYRTRSDGGYNPSDELPYRSQQKSWSDTAKIYLRNPYILSLGAVAALVLATSIIYNSENQTSNSIVHQNVIGNEKPETYIVKDGVKYYSHIDGKDLSDLLNK